MNRAGLSLGVVALIAAGTATAQETASLDRLEAAADSGRTDGLRDAVRRWLADATDVRPEERGRAGYLLARLTTDVDSARAAFATVALDGNSTYGALAWLRLAQMDLALGESRRALSDLERLRADHPTGPANAASWYWTARAWEQLGELELACESFERAIASSREGRDALVAERARSASRACGPGGLRFSLQVGAYSRERAAEAERAMLVDGGYPSRVVSEDGLHKVRVGRFANPEMARSLERRLRAMGLSVAVVAAES
ncbi:MAG: SPOR domain-containing protein [Gemmatimonadetes bacterium]|nr:SPOR domain-containing protein [Gemmatimonadota bacterium]